MTVPVEVAVLQGDGKVSHIDIRDIAAVAVKALTEDDNEGKAYTFTGPEALSNTRVAEILSEDTGREIRYVDLPPEQFKQALLAAGVPEWSTNALIDLQQLYRRGGAKSVTRDVEELLGRKRSPSSSSRATMRKRSGRRNAQRARVPSPSAQNRLSVRPGSSRCLAGSPGCTEHMRDFSGLCSTVPPASSSRSIICGHGATIRPSSWTSQTRKSELGQRPASAARSSRSY